MSVKGFSQNGTTYRYDYLALDNAPDSTYGYIPLDPDDFEFGNISFGSSSYSYSDNPNRIRTKEGVTLTLQKGDKICAIDWTNLTMYQGYTRTDSVYARTVDNDGFNNHCCIYDGEYALVVYYSDGTTPASVKEILQQIYIVRANPEVPDIVKKNVKEINLVNTLASNSDETSSYNQKAKRFTGMIITDIHGDDVRTKRAVSLLNTMKDVVDMGICLGDVPTSSWNSDGRSAEWYTSIVNKSVRPFLGVLGNHELLGTTATPNQTVAEATAMFLTPLSTVGQTLSLPYYTKRFSDYNVTVIVLNTYDRPDNSELAVETWMIQQTQYDWLVGVLEDVPADDTVIIMMHSMGLALTRDSSAFDSTLKNNSGVLIQPATWYSAYFTQLFGIVDAWQQGTSYSNSSTESGITVSVSCDFTSRGTGKFAGYFVGHEHADYTGTAYGYANQNMFCLASTNIEKNTVDDLCRHYGQKSEDCVTFFTIDQFARKVHLIRFGASMTIDGVERLHASYDY